eukprot:scaffold6966_cov112-Cylindrotheca_fusiformis.AAC.17
MTVTNRKRNFDHPCRGTQRSIHRQSWLGMAPSQPLSLRIRANFDFCKDHPSVLLSTTYHESTRFVINSI